MSNDAQELRAIGKPEAIAKVSATISKIVASIEPVVADAENEFHQFKYASWQAVQPHVRAACIEHNLTIIPSIVSAQYLPVERTVEGEKKLSTRILIEMSFTLVDDKSATCITIPWFGEADSSDDKGLQAAASIATKYFYLKLFKIATPEDEDSDGSAGGAGAPRPGSQKARDQAIAAKKATKEQETKKPEEKPPAKKPAPKAAPKAAPEPEPEPEETEEPKEGTDLQNIADEVFGKGENGEEIPPWPLHEYQEEPDDRSEEWPRLVLGYELSDRAKIKGRHPHFAAFNDACSQQQINAFRKSCKRDFEGREIVVLSLVDGLYRNWNCQYMNLADAPKGTFTIAIDFVNNASEETLKEMAELVDLGWRSDPFRDD